jgi:hypothetical protein
MFQDKVKVNDFGQSNVGKWKIYLYNTNGINIPIVEGQLFSDDKKYVIKDQYNGNILFVAPTGNVSFVVNSNEIEI